MGQPSEPRLVETVPPVASGINLTPASPFEHIRLQEEWDRKMGMTADPLRYKKTTVLLLHWHHTVDDLKVKPEVDRLERVFTEEYHFTVHKAVLLDPSRSSTAAQQARTSLAAFVEKEDGTNTLMIVYYAGHGGGGYDNETGNIKLTGKTNGDDKASFDWASVENNFKDTEADVLFIFDCCHAGLLCDPFTRRQGVCYQVLAACERLETTRSAGKESFTSALIFALEEMKGLPSFSTNQLLAGIRRAPHFPRMQQPLLSYRFADSRPECIHIARMIQGQDCCAPPIDDIRNQQYLDVRIHYSEELTFERVMKACDALRYLKGTGKLGQAQRIALIEKSSLGPKIERAVALWQKAWRESKKRRSEGKTNSRTYPMPEMEVMPSKTLSYRDTDRVSSSSSVTLSESCGIPQTPPVGLVDNERTPLLLASSSFKETHSTEDPDIVFHFRMLVKGIYGLALELSRSVTSFLRAQRI